MARLSCTGNAPPAVHNLGTRHCLASVVQSGGGDAKANKRKAAAVVIGAIRLAAFFSLLTQTGVIGKLL